MSISTHVRPSWRPVLRPDRLSVGKFRCSVKSGPDGGDSDNG